MRYLFFGAHPDDADLLMGGTAIKLIRAGHVVKFVSLCNGNAGHYSMGRRELAERRYQETQRSAAIAGLESYQVMDNSDCELECNLHNRGEIVRIIRRFAPDMVISHRTCTYHADHRETGQLVMDAAYLLKVPLYCEDTPIPEINPVFAYAYDNFEFPRPMRIDAAVEIDSVIEEKFKMMDCHVSQFYEWLPFDRGLKNFSTKGWGWPEKRAHLDKYWGSRFREMAKQSAKVLQAGRGGLPEYAESFELSPYGRNVTIEEFQKMFPK